MPHDPSPWGNVTHARLVCEALAVLSTKQHVLRTEKLHDKAQAHDVQGRKCTAVTAEGFGKRNNTKQREKVWNHGAYKGQNGRMERRERVCVWVGATEGKKKNDWECVRLVAEVRIFLMEYR